MKAVLIMFLTCTLMLITATGVEMKINEYLSKTETEWYEISDTNTQTSAEYGIVYTFTTTSGKMFVAYSQDCSEGVALTIGETLEGIDCPMLAVETVVSSGKTKSITYYSTGDEKIGEETTETD